MHLLTLGTQPPKKFINLISEHKINQNFGQNSLFEFSRRFGLILIYQSLGTQQLTFTKSRIMYAWFRQFGSLRSLCWKLRPFKMTFPRMHWSLACSTFLCMNGLLRILEYYYVGTLAGKVIAVVSSVTLEKLFQATAVGHQEGHFSAEGSFAFNPRERSESCIYNFFAPFSLLACFGMIFIHIHTSLLAS